MKAKVKVVQNTNTFSYYGLNKDNNFLEAPVCSCECGTYANLILKSDEELYGFIHEMLEEYECNYCAIFAVKNDNTVRIGIKTEDGINMYKCEHRCTKDNLFKNIQEDLEFHCYGIIKQVNECEYRIIMD